MKNKYTPIYKLGAIALAGVITSGAASAATTSAKDGMTTSTQTQSRPMDDRLPMLAPGVQELTLGGYLNWDDTTDYSFNISYGRFLTSNWLVGVQAGISGFNSDKNYNLGVFGEYNFLTGTQWVPFARATLGYSHPHDVGSSGFVGLDLGVKYFMRSNLAIFASVGGDWVISGDSDSDDGFDKQINLGLNFYF